MLFGVFFIDSKGVFYVQLPKSLVTFLFHQNTKCAYLYKLLLKRVTVEVRAIIDILPWIFKLFLWVFSLVLIKSTHFSLQCAKLL